MMNRNVVAAWLLLAMLVTSLGQYKAYNQQLAAPLVMLVMAATGRARATLLYPTLSPTVGLSLDPNNPCYQATALLQRNLKNRTLWAARMQDASAREVVGGLWGARFHLGNFDACLSTGAGSPVGARYCLVQLSPDVPAHVLQDRSLGHCNGPHATMWDRVPDLDPNSDALPALQGCGLMAGSVPLGEVLVALCVPEACRHAALQESLKIALQKSAFHAYVSEEHCVSHDEVNHMGTPARLFWIFTAVLSSVVVLAPFKGWTSWDWRRHARSLTQPEEPLAGLDLGLLAGIRVLNMFLIVLVHRGLNRAPSSNDQFTISESRTSLIYAIGHHSSLIVDSFLVMSGLLMQLTWKHRPKGPVGTLVNRWCRLTPTYAVMILFSVVAMQSLGSGPLWKSITGREAQACRRWWWTNLFYVNNLMIAVPDYSLCLMQGWSMGPDMQLFVVATLALPWVPLSRPGLDVAALVLSVALSFVSTLVHGWPPLFLWTERALQHPTSDPLVAMYAATHMRIAPFVFGIVTGRVMLRLKERSFALDRLSTQLLVWGSLLLMLVLYESSVVFSDLRQPAGPLTSAAYASLCPALWAASLGALVVALVFGTDTAVKSLLCWRPMVLLSRLSFGVYMSHYTLQIMQSAAERNPSYNSLLTMIRSGVSDFVISLLVSVWLYFAVEAPVRDLTRKALARKRIPCDVDGVRKSVSMNGAQRCSSNLLAGSSAGRAATETKKLYPLDVDTSMTSPAHNDTINAKELTTANGKGFTDTQENKVLRHFSVSAASKFANMAKVTAFLAILVATMAMFY